MDGIFFITKCRGSKNIPTISYYFFITKCRGSRLLAWFLPLLAWSNLFLFLFHFFLDIIETNGYIGTRPKTLLERETMKAIEEMNEKLRKSIAVISILTGLFMLLATMVYYY